MRTCRICREVKDSISFYPNRHVCKSCHKEQGYLWKDAHKQQWLETVARSKKRNYDLDSSEILKRNIEWQCPPWANINTIKSIYKEARALRLEVDHIIPLQGKFVSGLHVENNLQILSRTENRTKSNKYECDNSFG